MTADKAEDIEEGMVIEETFDVEAIERVNYGELVPWMEIPPSRRPRIWLVWWLWWLSPGVPGVKILH